jgi:hypothetical protein
MEDVSVVDILMEGQVDWILNEISRYVVFDIALVLLGTRRGGRDSYWGREL